MIRVENLSKSYGGKPALRGLTFRVEPGEIVGLVGKNGAGKSTALKILSAQMLPSGGEVFVDGISVPDFPRQVRARIGYLPETAPLYREMSVASYLTFVGRLRNIAPGGIGAAIAGVARETGLEEVIGERLGGLSRGYQQRVGIAQALIHKPPAILLDEPMAGLDPLQIVQIRDLIVSLRKRHTVLFSSHILSEITNVCDRVVLIDEGVVKAEGSEAGLRENLGGARRLSLLVKGSRAGLAEAVKTVPGLEMASAQAEGTGRVRAELVGKKDLRGALSKACVDAGLGLLELKAAQGGLEELFLQLLEPVEPVGPRSPAEPRKSRAGGAE